MSCCDVRVWDCREFRSVRCSVRYRVVQSVVQFVLQSVCQFFVKVWEHGRDHHDDLTLQDPAAVCCSVVPRVAVCCLQPLHHMPCAVAADTRPPASRCLPPPAPTSTTAVCPFRAAT